MKKIALGLLLGVLLLGTVGSSRAGDLTVDGNLNVNGTLRSNGLQENGGNFGIGVALPRARLEVVESPAPYAVSLPSSSGMFGRSIIEWHYQQGFDGTKYYIKLADVSHNNGSVQVEGLIGGHTPGDGKAAVNLLVSERDQVVRLGTVMGNLGGQDVHVYKNANNSSSIYLVTSWWAEVTLRLIASSTSNATMIYPNPARSAVAPTGTLAYKLSQDAQYVIGFDGKMRIGKRQGDIQMGEFGNPGSGD